MERKADNSRILELVDSPNFRITSKVVLQVRLKRVGPLAGWSMADSTLDGNFHEEDYLCDCLAYGVRIRRVLSRISNG